MKISTQAERLIQFLREAKKILVFTGAGISTGSGIPDFRGPNGIWKKRQPVYYQDFMTSETARIEHWDYKLEAWNAFRDARPNATHEAVAQLERAGKLLMVDTHNWNAAKTDSGIHLINLPPVAYVFEPGKPNGWVHATLQPESLRLELHCLDRSHRDHGQVLDLKWRPG